MRVFTITLSTTLALGWTAGAAYAVFLALRTERPRWAQTPVIAWTLWHVGAMLLALFVLGTLGAVVGVVAAAVARVVGGLG